MKKLLLVLISFFYATEIISQSNDCSTATTIVPGATCVNTAGTTAGATQSIPGCTGTANEDVWYQFNATSTSHQITVSGSAGFDAVVQLFSGSCSALVSLSCMDNSLSGQVETIYASGLTIGQTYRIRVYDWYAGAPSTSTFSICVTNPPPVPSNDNCSGATPLTVNTSCSATASTSAGATQSLPGCAGTADDDVWFSFVATNSVQTITVDPSSTMDPVVQLYSGTCASLSSIQCQDVGFTDGNEVINAVGLTVGSTYYIRVYDYYASTGGAPFTICVTGATTSAPVNDEPCSAIAIPVVTQECHYLEFTTTGATNTAIPGAPSSCAGGSAPQQGGFSASTKDVWFAITVPATQQLTITTEPGYGMSDQVYVLYSGTCGSLTQIACSDDNNYPGSANDLKPFFNITSGLVAGQVVYLRVFGYGASSGNFGFCVSTNTNDACANALYICDLNGYSASTSGAFSEDRPPAAISTSNTGAGQMFANNEAWSSTPTPDWYSNGGVNSGGPFGQAPAFNPSGGSVCNDVEIQNNSWIRFTAANTTATLNVAISYCFKGTYTPCPPAGSNVGGIQMQIFSSTGCNNFVPVSDFKEGSSNFTITAQGLTVGQDYYLMVDGFNGDICNYTISANSGVQFPDIVASANPICAGTSTLLTAPAGASSYEWYPGGATTQTITVTPSTTTTYTCIVSGVCGQRQTLTKTITVNQLPAMTSSASPAAICSGATLAVGLTSDITSTYSWIAANNASISGESTSAQTGNTINNTLTSSVGTVQTVIYTVTPTATSSGCAGTAQTVTVTVNPRPTISSVPSQTVCAGNATTLVNFTTNNPTTSTVNWTNNNTSIGLAASGSNATSISSITTNTVSSQQIATITATPVAPAGVGSCSGTATTFSITVNPTPVITVPSVSPVCGGSTVTVPVFTVSPSSTVTWTNNTPAIGLAASGTGNISSFTAGNVSSATTGTITASTTLNGCPAANQLFNITINPTPAVTLSSGASQTVCGGSTVNSISFTSTPSGATFGWNNTNPAVGIPLSGSGNIGAYTAPTPTVALHGTVTVTPSLGGCNGGAQQFTIDINPTPVITVPSVATVCGGATVSVPNFTVTPASTVSWSNNTTAIGLVASGTGNIGSFTSQNVSSVTTATVTASTTLGSCPAANQTFNITINPTPTFTVSSGATQTVCGGASANAINFTTTPSGSTVNWTNTGGSIGLAASGSGNISSFTVPTVSSSQTAVISAVVSTASCTNSSAQQFTVTVNPTPVITAVTNTTVCGNTNVPAINFSASPATIVNWTNNNTATGLAQTSGTGGILTFTASNVSSLATSIITLSASLNGCPANNEQYLINVNPLPTVTTTPSETPSGCGLSNGALTGVVVSGSGFLNYTWTNSSNVTVGTTANLSNVPAGSYNLTVSDANCTALFGPYTVTNPGAPSQPTITSSSGTTLCAGDALSLSASSSETNPTFTWTGPNASNNSNSLTIPAVTLADAGTYTVSIVLPNNCTSNQTVSVTVNANPVPSANSSSAVYCSGSQIDLIGSGGAGYQWSGPDTFSSTTQNPSITNSTTAMSGTYTLTVTNSAGCSANATTSVTVNQTPGDPVISANDSALCVGEDIQFNVSSSGATTYAWSGPNGFISTSSNPGLTGVSLAEAGTYTVIATANGCNSNSSVLNIAVNNNPVITTGALASPVCSGNTIDLQSTGGGNYSWAGPNGYSSTQQNPSILSATTQMSGTYTLTVINAANCSAVDSVSVLVQQTPSVPVLSANDSTLCEGDSLQLQANSNGGVTYSWVGPNSYSSGVQNPILSPVTVTQGGTYTVTATANNCTSAAETLSITVNTIPVVSANPAALTACSGDNISLTGTGGGTYSWSGPNGFTSSSSAPQLNGSTVSMTGEYILVVTTNGCSASDTVDVLVNPTPGLPVINASATSLCEGDNLQLNANSQDAINYAWIGPNGFSSSLQNPLITGVVLNQAGTYTVTATANGCASISETVTIGVNSMPVATAAVSSAFICSGNSVTLSATGGTNFSWTGPNGFTSSQQNNTINNIDVAASGTYTYTAINAGNCMDTATVSVIVAQTPDAAVTTGNSTCAGQPLVLTASGNGFISWYSDPALSVLITNDDTLYPNLPLGSSAVYYVTVSGNGCTSSVAPVSASYYNIDAAFNSSAVTGYAPLPVVFTNLSAGVDASDNYNWLINSNSFANTNNTSYTFEQGGTFNVMLIVTDNASGCTDTASVTIFIEDEIKVVIPNIFTPNGDGVNDLFELNIKGGKEAKGIIYNRWGQLIYEWDALNATWDGKLSNGHDVPDGIYFYLIRVTGFNGDVLDVPGNVTITR